MRSFVKPFGKGQILYQSGLIGNPNDFESLVTTGDVSLESIEDGPIVIQRYNNLIVSTGHTLTVANRCKGLILLVYGDLVVEGTITMTGKGAAGTGDIIAISSFFSGFKVEANFPAGIAEIESWIRQHYVPGMDVEAALLDAGLWPTIESASILPSLLGTIPAVGASGGAKGGPAYGDGTTGVAGTNRQTGGGGGGGAVKLGSYASAAGGNGAAGTSFAGGSGGGGAFAPEWTTVTASHGVSGGNGGAAAVDGHKATGGAGIPGGSGWAEGDPGETGAGGLLILCCYGNITINVGGTISSNGMNGGSRAESENCCTGGGSGGGSVNIFHKGSYTNNGTVQAAGGLGGTGGVSGYSGGHGAAGGAGCVTVEQFSH